MSEDALILSGAEDLTSSWGDDLVPKAVRNEKYYTPETQINKTARHNEIDYLRIQNGKRKQPDYIIVFRENGEIPNMEEARKAQEQWSGLPIVIVDKDKCIESEGKKVEEMISGYEAGDKSLARRIYQKIRNNRVTRATFCEDIDIEKFREEAETQEIQNKKRKEHPKSKEETHKRKVKIEDLEQNYDKVTPQERKEEVSTLIRINTQIQEIVNGKVEKEGEEVGGE